MSLRKYDGFSDFRPDLKKGARSLFSRCPWRTVFTHPDFLEAWYQSRPELRPIVLSSSADDGTPDGLVALAANENQIYLAGGNDVPVHGWLAEPLRGSFVIERYLGEVVRGFARVRLAPAPHAPVDWLSESRTLGRYAQVERKKRRIVTFDPARAKQKLDDKKNTSQAKEVKALGPLALVPARTEDLATFVSWHDHKRHARGLQATLHKDRIELYRRLPPEILSATVLTAGDAVLSAMLVYRDGPRAWLELLAENPEHERHSPGIIHLYLLEERWVGEVAQIDVTADDDWMHLIAEEVDAEEYELLFRAGDRMRRRATHALQRIVSRR